MKICSIFILLLKRTISLRCFFSVPTTDVKVAKELLFYFDNVLLFKGLISDIYGKCSKILNTSHL